MVFMGRGSIAGGVGGIVAELEDEIGIGRRGDGELDVDRVAMLQRAIGEVGRCGALDVDLSGGGGEAAARPFCIKGGGKGVHGIVEMGSAVEG